MTNLTAASRELFRRSPDQRFDSLDSLATHVEHQRSVSREHWEQYVEPESIDGETLGLRLEDGSVQYLNDWSFGQLCRHCRLPKETVNRLSPATAMQVVRETLPRSGRKPLQIFSVGHQAHSIHGTSYTRLYNAELLEVVRDAAGGFAPPPVGFNGGTGLYAGEQDMFCFLIEDDGWIDIRGEQFAPGFFVWNSEVGRRSVGLTTFWFQAVCQNHIVWDTTDVVEFTRKHTANVHDSLAVVQRMIRDLASRRDERRDGFAKLVDTAMDARVGDAEEASKLLAKHGFAGKLAQRAVDLAESRESLNVFGLVDALTRIAGKLEFAGDRLELDARAGGLLALAA